MLLDGGFGDDTQVATFGANSLKLEDALWTFGTREGVEPTNNFMERLLRRAVLWRKRSFGCWSAAGGRFVERIRTVVQTRRLQGKNVLDYLHDALVAHRNGTPLPTTAIRAVNGYFQPSLYRLALARLVQEEEPEETEDDDQPKEKTEEVLEKPLSLNEQRLGAVVASLRASGAKRILDLGCGEGKLIRELLKDKQFDEVVSLDVSIRSLEVAQRRLKVDRLPTMQANRLKLIHGSLMYRDKRLEGFDAAAVVEVVEHLDPPRLSAFERVLFEFARPGTVVLTTPNREYNQTWGTMPAGRFRHPDHRFEWTRQEFQSWAQRLAERFGYSVGFLPVGPEHSEFGPPTQMAVFRRKEDAHGRFP